MFLNKSVLLATITSVSAGIGLIPAGTGTRIKSFNPGRIPVHLQSQISNDEHHLKAHQLQKIIYPNGL